MQAKAYFSLVLLRVTGSVVRVVSALGRKSKPLVITRKLSYPQDNRAMRPIYGCPEKFRESPSMPTASIAEIFFTFVAIDPMCVQNLKFV